MRSTNIVLFLVALNAASLAVGATIGAELGIQPTVGGQGQINDVANTVESEARSGSAAGAVSGTLLGVITDAVGVLTTLDSLLFAGPNMLIQLGAPSILINPFKVIFIFVFGFDIAEFVSGRILS